MDKTLKWQQQEPSMNCKRTLGPRDMPLRGEQKGSTTYNLKF